MRYLLIVILIGASLVKFSIAQQQLPNSGFENWEITSGSQKDKPDDWNTVKSSVPSSVAFAIEQTTFKTTDSHSGTSAFRLKTVDPPSFPPGTPTINGIATTGTINTTSYEVEGGLSFTERPDSLVGWYKCLPVNNDFGTIEFVLKNNGTDTIGHARFETPTSDVTIWTRFSAPVIYRNSDTPAIGVALLSSSDGYNPVVDSELFVDDLELIYNPNSVDELTLTFGSYFNSDNIIISSELTRFNIEIYNIMGAKVLSSSNQKKISFNEKAGVYLVKMTTGTKSAVKKIIVD